MDSPKCTWASLSQLKPLPKMNLIFCSVKTNQNQAEKRYSKNINPGVPKGPGELEWGCLGLLFFGTLKSHGTIVRVLVQPFKIRRPHINKCYLRAARLRPARVETGMWPLSPHTWKMIVEGMFCWLTTFGRKTSFIIFPQQLKAMGYLPKQALGWCGGGFREV